MLEVQESERHEGNGGDGTAAERVSLKSELYSDR